MSSPRFQQSQAFNAADADLILRSCPNVEGISTDFRVHKQDLANASPVFRDMLELGEKQARCEGGLPIVDLEETAGTLAALLPFVQEDIDLMPRVSSIEHAALLLLWDASVKYRMHVVQVLTEEVMSRHLADSAANVEVSLQIHKRAGRHERTCLATATLEAGPGIVPSKPPD